MMGAVDPERDMKCSRSGVATSTASFRFLFIRYRKRTQLTPQQQTTFAVITTSGVFNFYKHQFQYFPQTFFSR